MVSSISMCFICFDLLFSIYLTCRFPGDDRPCSRCVKRGCAPSCRDGVRKKAKYLDDTPADALMRDNVSRGGQPFAGPGLTQQPLPDLSSPTGNVFSGQAGAPSSYPVFPSGPQVSLPSTPLDQAHAAYGLASNAQGAINQSPFQLSTYPSSTLPANAPITSNSIQNTSFEDLFPPNSYDMDRFDMADFDNRYGAAELGILNHMSYGMANSPPSDGTGFNPGGSTYTPGNLSSVYEQSPSEEAQLSFHANPSLSSWSNEPPSDFKATANNYRFARTKPENLEGMMRQEVTPSFAIGNSTLPSPSSMSSPQGMTMAGYDDSPTNRNILTNLNPSAQAQVRQDPHQSHRQQGFSGGSASVTSTPSLKVQTMPSRRHRNPSTVYEDVKNPYSYTAAFHSLTALIQRRFSPHKTAHIAKALAAIRPSFISCTMKLNKEDLVFMEKCLQRTLWEYEDYISATATPTIICRRTGEVVAVGKEFSILTGWSANVLLGREPNLNVNRGGTDDGDSSSGPPGTGSSSLGGTNTPRNPNDTRTELPVNIVDLLDDDSACEFFDDYAHLAFGDSRGSVTSPCKLLKYQTASEIDLTGNLEDHVGSRLKRPRDQAAMSSKPGSKGTASSTQFGSTNMKVDCMLCWSVKRDVFDIPMLCVLNVSPCPFYYMTILS